MCEYAGWTVNGAGMADGMDWRQWLAEHGPPLVLLARQWIGSHADAQDVVQEAFIRFWRSRDRAIDPTAYLYACTRRHCQEWRRSGARRRHREESAARSETTSANDLFTQIEQDERRQLIESALCALPPEQREVVIMRLWGGLTFPQIAEATAVSTDTASSRYRYAIAKLREQLAEEHAP